MVLFISAPSFSQDEKSGNPLKVNEKYKIKAFVGFQFWSSYTLGQEVYSEESMTYTPVKNRFNTQLRRSRIGVKGEPFNNIKFNLTGALDLVGRDLLSATIGGGNNGSSPSFRLWNAYVQWKIKEKSDAFHLTVGYMVPQIGRESISSALKVSSIEKSISQFYLRKHLTGIGPGRSMGINLGGYLLENKNRYNISYDLGLFNPLYESFSGNSLGYQPSLLTTGRVVFHLGDSEHAQYSIGHKVNYGGQRNGISIAFAGAYQGKTDIFNSNTTYGVDMLMNWGNLNIDGEWYRLLKTGQKEFSTFQVNSQTGYIRMSYNIARKNNRILEPTFMYGFFRGPMTLVDQELAVSVKDHAGVDSYLDIGINLHFNKSVKLMLHYVYNTGSAGDSSDLVPSFNNYYQQSGLGAIKRGNWLGLGLITMF